MNVVSIPHEGRKYVGTTVLLNRVGLIPGAHANCDSKTYLAPPRTPLSLFGGAAVRYEVKRSHI